MSRMRAKFELLSITPLAVDPPAEELDFTAVTEKEFDEDGNSEDNTFSKWTPTGDLTITVTNPNLIGKFKRGQKFYLDFTLAEDWAHAPSDQS